MSWSSDFFSFNFFFLILSFCGQIDGQLLLVCYERVRLKRLGTKEKRAEKIGGRFKISERSSLCLNYNFSVLLVFENSFFY
jgi:hypothetical protein